ncbi:MAG: prolipoprotein diacylglyceryl transferase [Cucumibacter sp.]
MIFPEIDPVAFSIGPLAIRWYALGYIVGIGIAWLYGRLLVDQRPLWLNSTPPFTPAQWLDFLFWAVVGIVVGGRAGYVLFYNPFYFAAHPAEIVMTWQGGMSFHGGLIGLCLAVYFIGRRNKSSVLSALDLMGAISPIGLFAGRVGNFINGELYGRETQLPWGIVFPAGGPEPRHPTQLYEAGLEGILLFLVLRYATHMRLSLRRPGLTAGLFGIGYGLSRILVETVREPDAHIGYLYGGWLTMGMIYSFPVLLAGVWLIAVSGPRKQRRE